MLITTPDVRQSLAASDPEFRRLTEEHSRCEFELKQILTGPYLNSEELVKEVTLKKIKLRLKDQMEQIIARHQRGASDL